MCKRGVAPIPSAAIGDSLDGESPRVTPRRPALPYVVSAAPGAKGARAHAWKIVSDNGGRPDIALVSAAMP